MSFFQLPAVERAAKARAESAAQDRALKQCAPCGAHVDEDAARVHLDGIVHFSVITILHETGWPESFCNDECHWPRGIVKELPNLKGFAFDMLSTPDAHRLDALEKYPHKSEVLRKIAYQIVISMPQSEACDDDISF